MGQTSVNRFLAILFLILVVTLPILIHLSVFHMFAYNKAYYEYMLERHDVALENRTQMNAEILSFLSGGEEPDATLTDREIGHLHDVRERFRAFLFLFFFLLMLDALLVVFLYRMSGQKKSIIVMMSGWSGTLTVTLSLLLGVGAVFFSRTFGMFHSLLFREGSWLFPADSVLITLYPESFFLETFTLIVIGSACVGMLLLFTGLVLRSHLIGRAPRRLYAVVKKHKKR